VPGSKRASLPCASCLLSTPALQLPGGVGGERMFMQLIYRGFDQRRKMLRNSLQPAYTPPEVRWGLCSKCAAAV